MNIPTVSKSQKLEYKVKQIFFPRFDHKKEWKVKYSNKIPGTGLCDRENKILFIQKKLSYSNIRLTLIHEMCHAVTQDHHGVVWQKRMLNAAKVAREIGFLELSEELLSEVKEYKKTERILARTIYQSIEDFVAEAPRASFKNIIKFVANDYGFYPDVFLKRYKRSIKVYKKAKQTH